MRRAITTCRACPRLVAYCSEVAVTKRRAYRDEHYWGRPVPGFGDLDARVLFVGLAPGAHGANRTGRVFTGDSSADFLTAALHRAGFTNQPVSRATDDGLVVRDAYIATAVRCAPPDNAPLPEERDRCLPHLEAELALLPRLQVVVGLGTFGFDAWLTLLRHRGITPHPRPRFAHGTVVTFGPGVPVLVGCYHPSRQNTNTGRLTPGMMDNVFDTVRSLLRQAPG